MHNLDELVEALQARIDRLEKMHTKEHNAIDLYNFSHEDYTDYITSLTERIETLERSAADSENGGRVPVAKKRSKGTRGCVDDERNEIAKLDRRVHKNLQETADLWVFAHHSKERIEKLEKYVFQLQKAFHTLEATGQLPNIQPELKRLFVKEMTKDETKVESPGKWPSAPNSVRTEAKT